MREIIFDTETTGMHVHDGNRIIEIGAVEMVNKVLTGRTYHQYLNPDRDIEPGAYQVHGISLEQLKDKPRFADIADEFWEFFGDGKLVAHNAKFDIGYFNMELGLVGRDVVDPTRVVDTLAIAKLKFPGAPVSLDALCKRFGVSNAHRVLHGALLDSELLADVYVELTGGRQTSFLVDNQRSQMAATNADATPMAPQRQRPTPLVTQLSEAEREAHRALMGTMKTTPIWERWKDRLPEALSE